MANDEHLQILKQGVKVWNKWREENPNIQPALADADLRSYKLDEINLTKADCSRINLSGAYVRGADLERANFVEADFNGTNLEGASLNSATLNSVSLKRSNLFDTSLAGADLTNSDLSLTILVVTNLAEANLKNATLELATFNSANLNRANLAGAVFYRTVLNNIDLSNVIGLETVIHDSPSTIGIDTLYLSKGRIPEVFLRGCGVPEDFIAYARSLVTNPIEYYSSFISHSSKDKEFVQRLYADLQAKHIRCWYAPEDLKIGDKFRTRIEESIRIYDKVMLVLSENSIQSLWVEDEVEAALERERRHPGWLVLFPIRLDDAVMETNQAWAASLRRTRHIGDFSHWKNHDSYQKAFDRLLRDLKSETKATAAQAPEAR